jgi:hypothetical protein
MVGNDPYRCVFDVAPSKDGWVMLGDVVCQPIPRRQP